MTPIMTKRGGCRCHGGLWQRSEVKRGCSTLVTGVGDRLKKVDEAFGFPAKMFELFSVRADVWSKDGPEHKWTERHRLKKLSNIQSSRYRDKQREESWPRDVLVFGELLLLLLLLRLRLRWQGCKDVRTNGYRALSGEVDGKWVD